MKEGLQTRFPFLEKVLTSTKGECAPSRARYSLGRGGQDGVVVVVLLLLAENLQLQEELLLLEELGVRRVHVWRRLLVRFLVRRDVLVVLQLLHLRSHDHQMY